MIVQSVALLNQVGKGTSTIAMYSKEIVFPASFRATKGVQDNMQYARIVCDPKNKLLLTESLRERVFP